MTQSQPPKPPGRRPKRTRSDPEIEAAAWHFAADWTAGDSVETWLYWHEGRSHELSEMVLRGWSWADVSRALFKAGICYGTGRPIPDASLRAKAYRARRRNRAAAEPEPLLQETGAADPGNAAEDLAPAFTPVALRDGSRPTGLDASNPAAKQRSPVVERATADEVFERVFGRKPERQEDQP